MLSRYFEKASNMLRSKTMAAKTLDRAKKPSVCCKEVRYFVKQRNASWGYVTRKENYRVVALSWVCRAVGQRSLGKDILEYREAIERGLIG